MRHLLTFDVAGSACGGTLDAAVGDVGILIVTGGTQTRIGSHRLFERLGASFAAAGHPCFRFDRRGVGDSEGIDPGFRESVADLQAAAAAFRSNAPSLQRIIGLGLCDGATALMLSGGAAGVDALILINPWLVEAEPDLPPAPAIRRRYGERLTSRDGWKRLLTGRVSFRKAASGLRRAMTPMQSQLGEQALAAMGSSRLGTRLILARGDATAIAAEQVWRSAGGLAPVYIETDSHTFARPGNDEALRAALLQAIEDLSRE
jgi:exosortase A-associated hydrolase 1